MYVIGTGPFTTGSYAPLYLQGQNGACNAIAFNASLSNSIYTDNGLILPKSISKQSYIIYK